MNTQISYDEAADQIVESESIRGALLMGRIMSKCMNLLIAKLDETESALISLQPDSPVYHQAEKDVRAAMGSLQDYNDALGAYGQMIDEIRAKKRLRKDTKQWVN